MQFDSTFDISLVPFMLSMPGFEAEHCLEPLISENEIREKVAWMAATIRVDYQGEDLLLVAVLKGSFLFLADLCRQLGDRVTLDFVQVSSYGDQKSTSGIVQIRKDLDINIEGRHVLIVEDIVDTGITLSHLRELFSTRKPKSLKVASLLSKPDARERQTQIEYVGFEIPNEFVVGYGLDFAERYRNLPYIAVLREG
jgi:hypoxanthine phosphoribosyltransferase